ncbi:hypothetical protein SLE2022_077070 [Rubroshorea leprosula]
MRSILDIKHPPKHTLLNHRKVREKHRIDHPKPNPSKKGPQSCPGENLSNGVVPQIHPRIHGEQSRGPGQEQESPFAFNLPDPSDTFRSQECDVHSEEEHVLGVAGRPSMGIAGFQESTGLGSRLLDGFLDEVVDELRYKEAESKEHALELAAEDEMGNEPTEADEDRNERDPG